MTFNLSEGIHANARWHPDRLAVTDTDQHLSWAELDERVDRVAQGLHALGIGRGDRVAFVGRNGLSFYELYFGLARIGAVVAPLNWRMSAGEIAGLLVDAQAKLVVADAEFRDLIPPDARTITSGAEFDGWRDSHLPQVAFDGPYPPEQVIVQSYTSGTTGMPKGVLITNRMVEISWHTVREEYTGVGPDAVILITMPVHHVGGTGPAIWAVAEGATLVLTAAFEAERVLDVIEHYGVTFMNLAPVMVSMLAEAQSARSRDISSLKCIIYGGQSINGKAVEKIMSAMDIELTQVYGLTETAGGPITRLGRIDHYGSRGRSVGRPVRAYQVAAFGPDDEALPVGAVGEIRLRSEQTTPGYWLRPEATASLYRGGWLCTGDAGYVDADGYLFVTDRIKDMIVTGGENVFPAEVEHVLINHPAIQDVSVVGGPDDKWGETVAAFVVVDPDQAVTGEDIIAWSRDKIAGYKRPHHVILLPELPKNAAGKVMRRELRASLWQGREQVIG
jgi:acyl-CoA synthetase (AMP-forming)/AMP-acid ligase II